MLVSLRRFAHCGLLAALVLLAASCSATRSRHLEYAAEPGLELDAPAADEAAVVFYRPAFMGHAVHAAVYEDDEFVGFVMADSHHVHRTTPGTHRYAVVSESADFMDAELDGGRIYFAQVVPRMGWWRARFSLLPVGHESKAFARLDADLAESYAVTQRESAADWAADNNESAMQKCQANLSQWLEKDDRPCLVPEDGLTRFPQ